jgi:nucleotide-binding universal stress UspA family protein
MTAPVFRRIIVPTDFSELSRPAWDLTQRLAKALGSEVVLVHVFVDPPVYGDPPAVTSAWEAVLDAQKWVADELERWADRARKAGIDVRTVVLTGSAASEIVRHATEERADAVIMGTHGRTGLGRMVLGSVADRVIHTAPCPVLTVRVPEAE